MREFDEIAYQSRIEELFLRHQSVQTAGFNGNSYKPGLDGISAFATALGNPQTKYKTCHVAGTNGKGSVCSMLAAALASTGLRTGLYTSPHLEDFRERIKIVEGDGFSMIPKEDVWEFLETWDCLSGNLSFFEITTGLAFWWFEKAGVDAAVIETGLGGRLDSTNIITPAISIITSIGLDHCAILGDSRAEIAREKAGIFKPGVPALVASHDPETSSVFGDVAAQCACELHFADSYKNRYDSALLDLRGPYQEMNLRTVSAALDILGLDACGMSEAIANSGRITGLRGRWECLRGPVAEDGTNQAEVICDIAHNPPALEINFGRLAADGRHPLIVYGVMADKALDDIAPLFPYGSELFLSAPDSPRSMPADELWKRLSSLRPDLSARPFNSVKAAVCQALADAGANDLVYIGGSTFVVAEAIACFR